MWRVLHEPWLSLMVEGRATLTSAAERGGKLDSERWFFALSNIVLLMATARPHFYRSFSRLKKKQIMKLTIYEWIEIICVIKI
jgi:hypothetical protein